jgi:hypothetical protein
MKSLARRLSHFPLNFGYKFTNLCKFQSAFFPQKLHSQILWGSELRYPFSIYLLQDIGEDSVDTSRISSGYIPADEFVIHSFNKYLLDTYQMPCPVLLGDKVASLSDKVQWSNALGNSHQGITECPRKIKQSIRIAKQCMPV